MGIGDYGELWEFILFVKCYGMPVMGFVEVQWFVI